MSILHIIQTGCTNIHFWFFMTLYKDAIQDRNLHLCSSTKYCTNANNPLKKLILLKKQARLSIIPKYSFLDIKFFLCFYLEFWVENRRNRVHPFKGHPVFVTSQCLSILTVKWKVFSGVVTYNNNIRTIVSSQYIITVYHNCIILRYGEILSHRLHTFHVN